MGHSLPVSRNFAKWICDSPFSVHRFLRTDKRLCHTFQFPYILALSISKGKSFLEKRDIISRMGGKNRMRQKRHIRSLSVCQDRSVWDSTAGLLTVQV